MFFGKKKKKEDPFLLEEALDPLGLEEPKETSKEKPEEIFNKFEEVTEKKKLSVKVWGDAITVGMIVVEVAIVAYIILGLFGIVPLI